MAKHFGVSTAAISKALNGLPGVSDELRQSIIEYARDNKYVPNIYGKGLKGKAPKVVGVIITDNANPSYSRIVKGIEAEAEKLDYSVILCNSGDEWSKENRYLEMLVEKSVLGILIVPSQRCADEPSNRYEILEKANVPFVLMNRTIDGLECDSVVTDNVQASAMAVHYLVEHGHSKIIHVTSEKNISTAVERMLGFKRAMHEHKLRCTDADVYRINDYSRDNCVVAMAEILRKRNEFTAVYAFNDSIAFACIKAIMEHGLSVPDDIAVIGYDDNGFADISLVPLTTVPQESEYLGAIAFEMIIDKIATNRRTPLQKVLLPRSIAERKSV